MINLRVIGDVHGQHEIYYNFTKDVPYTIQVGDMGYSYNFISKYVAPETNKIVLGNHENYENLPPHSLGDFGLIEVPNFGSIFFVRGAFSLDYKERDIGMDWFPEEELSIAELGKAIDLYKEIKPDFVISHECPQGVLSHFAMPGAAARFGYDTPYIKTKTSQALEAMRVFHKPKMHIFGHYHRTHQMKHEGTEYLCLGELSYVDFESKDKVLNIYDRFCDIENQTLGYCNRSELENTKQCACYYCEETFSVDKIEEWTDAEQTAICPLCSVDAVIPYPVIDKKRLRYLNMKFFARS
jgi:predicted phosphodiesterase